MHILFNSDEQRKLASQHTFSAGYDIRPKVISTPSESASPRPRPRGTGKLLSTTQGVGLALLRLEQVEAFERGEIQLAFETEEGAESVKSSWGVTPWRPSWWPNFAMAPEVGDD